MLDGKKLAVVIPSYKVIDHIDNVISGLESTIDFIVVVDDKCPQRTGGYVLEKWNDPRICVVKNEVNLGVGGAVKAGYMKSIELGADIIVKMDGDDQMDPKQLVNLVKPLIEARADYAKGNRFFSLEEIHKMPKIRILGNIVLSFVSKLSTGYWNVFDPTNGYTAITARVVENLPLEKLSNRYFFETDMLFRLYTLRATVCDVAMPARYGNEKSNLSVSRVLPEFLGRHTSIFIKRIFYSYFLRDLNIASVCLVCGFCLLVFGLLYGAINWISAYQSGQFAPLGIIMLATIPFILGFQLLLNFFSFDYSNVPRDPISDTLPSAVTK
jgi:dolichol-phosphate mannosyltransferase